LTNETNELIQNEDIKEEKVLKENSSVGNIYTNNSLLKEIIKEKLEKKEITEDSFLLFNSKLKENGLDYLRQWKSLSEIEKAIFPLGLRKILDEVSGKIIKKKTKNYKN